MKKVFYLLLMILCFSFLVGCNLDELNPGEKTEEVEEGIKELKTPSVSISSDGIASWKAVKNATGYAYIINDSKDKSKEKTTKKTEVKLKLGESIKVKALGDGENYEDSPYSKTVVYTGEAIEETVEQTVEKTPVKYSVIKVFIHTSISSSYYGQTFEIELTIDEYINLKEYIVSYKNHELLGWATTPNGDVEFLINDFIYYEDIANYAEIHIYPVWREKTNITTEPNESFECKVTYHANDGSGSTRVQYIEAYKGFSLLSLEFSREGYRFAGWATSSNGVAIYYDYQYMSGIYYDLDLYAIWKEENYNEVPFAEENFANGAISYVTSSYEKRTEILGLLEKYAVKNHLTGLTLFENGGYVMYHPSVIKGTNEYVPGFGFGVLSDGYLEYDLEGEANPDYKRYYHLAISNDPYTINYMDSFESNVSDLNKYISSSYWSTQLNETKDGYEWFGVQSNSERPESLEGVTYEDGVTYAKKYRFEVKVGSEYRYNTLTTNQTLAKYNGREVQLEDYLTPFRILHTQAFNMARGRNGLVGTGSIKGMEEYYFASEYGINYEAWEDVGLKAYYEDGKAYLEVEFNVPCNEFYAMYYLSSQTYSPIPADFVSDLGNGDFSLGVSRLGKFTDNGLTPVDTTLSVGPYTVEKWEQGNVIIFKKNPYYNLEGSNKYKIAGVHFTLTNQAYIDLFLNNMIHSCGIPTEYLSSYINDYRTTTTVGDSTSKLNLNTCTQEEWEKLFGEYGSVMSTDRSEYWQCEPIMSNDNFINGLSYAINRKEFAEFHGKTPSNNFFSSSYFSNPESGIAYNNTEAHKNVREELDYNTEYGYNFDLAVDCFKAAANELIACGYYKPGDTITLEIAWQYNSDISNYHDYITKYILDAWNAANTGLNLRFDYWIGGVWSDVYYEKMLKGQFDIAFGNISGNTLDPLNFLEILKSDNSSGFTLNWGCNTSEVSEDLFYDGMYWSFDALWEAANSGGYFEKGRVVPTIQTSQDINYYNENRDGSVTMSFDVNILEASGLNVDIEKVTIWGYVMANNASGYEYQEVEMDYQIENGVLTFTVPADVVSIMRDTTVSNIYGDLGIDVYYTVTINNYAVEGTNTIYFQWEID